ncbi:MAG: YtxH domain-containing protein [Endomicrobiia bacterium]
MDRKDTLIAFLLGATVGVAVGLLYAPKSGKETRAQLKRLGEDFADKGKEFVKDGKAKISEVIEKGKAAYSKQAKKSSDIQEDIVEE